MKIIRLSTDFWKAEGAATQNNRLELQGNVLLRPAVAPVPDEELFKKESLNEEELADKVDQMNKTALIFNRKMQFQIHEETQRVMVKIINSESGEVISEIPSKKLLDMAAKMEEMVGMIFDKRF